MAEGTVDPISGHEGPATAVSQDISEQLDSVRATQTAVAIYDAAPQDVLVGVSNNGVPIEAVRFGSGDNKIVLVGGMHSGLSPSTVDIAEELIDHFTNNGQDIPEEISLYIIPEMNPDSISENDSSSIEEIDGRANARGVDLRHNWDCDWKKDPVIDGEQVNWAGGTSPLSEIETNSLSGFLRSFKPTAVIFWYAGVDDGLVQPGGCFDRTVSDPLAELYTNASGYLYYDPPRSERLEGDAANWIGLQGVPSVNVTLPDYEDADFENNLEAIYALLEVYTE